MRHTALNGDPSVIDELTQKKEEAKKRVLNSKKKDEKEKAEKEIKDLAEQIKAL